LAALFAAPAFNVLFFLVEIGIAPETPVTDEMGARIGVHEGCG
jgi:hypothetical protein